MYTKQKFYSFISLSVILTLFSQASTIAPIKSSFISEIGINVSSIAATINSRIKNLTAKKPKPEKVELKDKRSPNSKTYLNPDGSYTTEISQAPIYYKNNKGTFGSIDTTLKKDPDGYKVEKNSLQANFGNKAGNLLKITNPEDETSIEYKIADSAKSDIAPTKKEDNKVIYENYKPDTSLAYTVQNGRVKEEIILDKPPADNTFSFEMDLKGLKPEQQKDGSIKLIKKGKTVFLIEKPFMTAANTGAPLDMFYSNDVEMKIEKINGSIYNLKVIPSKEWLDDPQRVYPVKIDPTFTTQDGPIEDTTIYQGTPDSAYGGLGRLYVGGLSETQQYKSLIKYDLSDLPKDAKVNNAVLENFNPIYTEGSDEYLTNTNTGSVYYQNKALTRIFRATAPWNGSSTWNTIAGNYDPNVISQSASENPGLNVINVVKGWQSGAYPNNGFMLDNTSRINIIGDNTPPASAEEQYIKRLYSDPLAFVGGWNWGSSDRRPGGLAHNQPFSSTFNGHRYLNRYDDLAYFFVPAYSEIDAWYKTDISSPASELQIEFFDGGSWEHRAMWGDGTISRYTGPSWPMGYLPRSDMWQKLAVNANQINLNNRMINGMAFNVLNGGARFDEVYGWRKAVFKSSEGGQDLVPRLVVTYSSNNIGREEYKTYKDFSGVSVDLQSGNGLVEETDLQLHNRGPATRVTRTTNTQDAYIGIFGFNWRSYPNDLRIDYSGPTVVVTTETGARHSYNQNPDGTYQRPPGVSDDLIKNADDTSTIKRRDLSKVNFDSQGRASEEIDKNGNKLTFNYGENGNISSIVDANDRQTTFSYNANNVVDKITDFAGKTTTYEYDATLPVLKKVTNRAGETIIYDYKFMGQAPIPPFLKLNSIKKYANAIEPHETKIEYYYNYGLYGAVKNIINPLTKTMAFSYTTENVFDESDTPQRERSYTKLTDPKNNEYVYYFDSKGLVTKLGEPLGPSVDYPAPEPDFPDDATVERDVIVETEDFVDDFEDWESFGNEWEEADWESNDQPPVEIETVRVWNKAWEPTFAKENIPAPEISQPLQAGKTIYYQYNDGYNQTVLVNKDGTFSTYKYDDKENKIREVNHGHGVLDNEKKPDWSKLCSQDEEACPPAGVDCSPEKHRETLYEYGNPTFPKLLTKQITPDNKTTSYAYDNNGNLQRETDAENKTTTYVYDENPPANQEGSRTETVTDPKGDITTNYYDEFGNMTRTEGPLVINPDATTYREVTNFTYDELGNKKTETKVGMGTTEYDYDALGRLTDQINPPNEQGEYSLSKNIYDDVAGTKTEELNEVKADGNQTLKSKIVYTFNKADQLISQKDLMIGAETLYEYDDNGNKVKEKKLMEVGSSLYSTTSYEYDELNRLTKEIGPDGNWTAYKYDSFGNVVKEGTPDGTTVNLYDKAGNEIAVASPDGSVSKTIYDKGGNEVTGGDGSNNVSATNYDNNANISKVIDPTAQETTYQYDPNQNETTVTSPTPNGNPGTVSTSIDYNEANQVKTETDQKDQVNTETNYNSSGQEASINQLNNKDQSMQYNDAGSLTNVDAANNTTNSTDTKTTYDALGNPDTVTTDPAGSSTTALTQINATYDEANRVKSLTNLLGITINFDYDLLGNLKKLSDSIGAAVYTTDYEYDAASKLKSITDLNGNRTNFTYKEGTQSNGDTFETGDLARTTLANGLATDFSYDAGSKITQLSNIKGNDTLASYNYTYDTSGNVTNTVETDGSTIYDYDSLSRLEKVVNKDASIVGYTYDAQGNRLTKQKQAVIDGTLTLTELTSYTYSPANELLSAISSQGSTVSYIYDANGNTQTRIDPTGTTTYTYDNKNQLVRYNKEYQDSGNMPDKWTPYNLKSTDGRSTEEVKDGTYSLKISGANIYKRAVQRINESGSTGDTFVLSGWNKTIGSSTTGLCIDILLYLNKPDGSRVFNSVGGFSKSPHDWTFKSRAITASTDYTSMDVYVVYHTQTGTGYFDGLSLTKNGGPQLLKQPSFELDGSNVEYVYDGKGNRFSKTVDGATTYYSYDTAGNIVSEYQKDGETLNTIVRYVRDNNGKAISMIQGSNTYYFIYNGHGDVTALTDSSGNVVATYSYDEFGNQTSSTGSVYNPLRYSSANNAYYDTETSLYKMGARYYQPDVGRWLTRDSYKGEQASPQSLNKYIYVANNPINNTDSTGYWPDTLHQDVSFIYGIRAGFKSSTAWIIGVNNAIFDLDSAAVFPETMQYHFNMKDTGRYHYAYKSVRPWRYSRMRNGDTRISFAYKKLKQASSEWNKKQWSAYKQSLGKGLHSVQDTYAHLNIWPWEHQTGEHAAHYDDKDQLGAWRYSNTIKATELYLRDFFKLIKRKAE